MIGIIVDTLGIRGLREMGYNITKTNLKPRFVLDLLEKQAKLPSSSEMAKADTIELEEIAKSMEDLIFQINNQSQIKQIDDLTEDLKVRQESIDILKGRQKTKLLASSRQLLKY